MATRMGEDMLGMIGFSDGERDVIQGLMGRFRKDGHRLCDLVRVERANMPGYNGRVVPQPKACGGFDITMYLACCSPFTVAHELAHIVDINARRQETQDHLSLCMPNAWHLAHRMSSEYTANRLACSYVNEEATFGAFQSDHVGMLKALRRQDWSDMVIYYALIQGLFDGLGRYDCDPLRLLPPDTKLPEIVSDGIADFRGRASLGFEKAWDLSVMPRA